MLVVREAVSLPEAEEALSTGGANIMVVVCLPSLVDRDVYSHLIVKEGDTKDKIASSEHPFQFLPEAEGSPTFIVDVGLFDEVCELLERIFPGEIEVRGFWDLRADEIERESLEALSDEEEVPPEMELDEPRMVRLEGPGSTELYE